MAVRVDAGISLVFLVLVDLPLVGLFLVRVPVFRWLRCRLVSVSVLGRPGRGFPIGVGNGFG